MHIVRSLTAAPTPDDDHGARRARRLRDEQFGAAGCLAQAAPDHLLEVRRGERLKRRPGEDRQAPR
jgi:hypothetical protein